MANYVIKKQADITVQENDHWSFKIGIDPLLPFSTDQYTFAVFSNKPTPIFIKPNLTKTTLDVDGTNWNAVEVTGLPSDTLGKANCSLTWELQRKGVDDKFVTIGEGKFHIRKTRIANV